VGLLASGLRSRVFDVAVVASNSAWLASRPSKGALHEPYEAPDIPYVDSATGLDRRQHTASPLSGSPET
jgi:hypothetical protein